MAMANQPIPPPVGHCLRVLFNSADRLRKKIITKLNNLFYFFTPYPTYNAPKIWHRASPTCPTHRISPPCSSLSWLPVFGWLLCLGQPIGSRFTPPCVVFSLFLCCSIWRSKQWDSVSPHAPPPARHLSRITFTNNACTWLVVVLSF